MPKLRSKPPTRPIITLTTDFGLSDPYVAEMKGVLLKACPDAQLVDVTHEIAPQDLVGASVILERVLAAFPAGTTHLAVVDPGVGSIRKLLVWSVCGQNVVCPDNGLITWAARRLAPGKCSELTWRPSASGHTFHGRDIMAPVAGRLATGGSLRAMAQPMESPILLDIAPSTSGTGYILHVDHFGNAMTNIPAELAGPGAVRVKGKAVGPVRQTYSDVEPGKTLALVGSSGLIEIAVRNGSAVSSLKLRVGDPVRIG
jgi:S-adenosyl-L-methionine hydrolase (adenosine-forming)